MGDGTSEAVGVLAGGSHAPNLALDREALRSRRGASPLIQGAVSVQERSSPDGETAPGVCPRCHPEKTRRQAVRESLSLLDLPLCARHYDPLVVYLAGPMVVYLAGPMTGRPDLNYPAFRCAAEWLRDLGFAVVNPAENFDGRQDLPRSDYAREDFGHLLEADAVVVLPGWERSRGAALEVMFASELDVAVFDFPDLDLLYVHWDASWRFTFKKMREEPDHA